MPQFESVYPAAELDFTAPPPTRPSRRVTFRDYVFGITARAAAYGAMVGFALGVLVGTLFGMRGAPWYLVAALVSSLTIGVSGIFGVLTLSGGVRSFIDEFGREPVPVKNKDPEGHRPTVIPSPPNPSVLKFALLDGRIVEIEVQDRRAVIQWFRAALDETTGVSLGKNDATQYGIGGGEWREMFNLFKHFGVVEERKNQKPLITGQGATALARYLKHYG